MRPRLFLGVGSALFASGVILGALLLFHVESARRGDQPATEVTSRGDCPDLRLELVAPRVMSESESAVLEATLTSPGPWACTLDVWADAAPALDVRPTAHQSITLHPGQPTGKARWSLNPTRAGSWDVRIIAGGLAETRRIKVTTILGLSPFITALLSPILAILGPMTTLPYWIDRWRHGKAPRRRTRLAT